MKAKVYKVRLQTFNQFGAIYLANKSRYEPFLNAISKKIKNKNETDYTRP